MQTLKRRSLHFCNILDCSDVLWKLVFHSLWAQNSTKKQNAYFIYFHFHSILPHCALSTVLPQPCTSAFHWGWVICQSCFHSHQSGLQAGGIPHCWQRRWGLCHQPHSSRCRWRWRWGSWPSCQGYSWQRTGYRAQSWSCKLVPILGQWIEVCCFLFWFPAQFYVSKVLNLLDCGILRRKKNCFFLCFFLTLSY